MTAKCIFCGAEEEVDHEIKHPVCDRPECVAQAKHWGYQQLIGEWMSRHVEVRQEEGEPTMFRLNDAAAAKFGFKDAAAATKERE